MTEGAFCDCFLLKLPATVLAKISLTRDMKADSFGRSQIDPKVAKPSDSLNVSLRSDESCDFRSCLRRYI